MQVAKTRSIRAKLALAGASILIATVVLLSLFHDQILARILRAQFVAAAETAMPLMNASIAAPLAARDFASLDALIEEAIGRQSLTHMVLVDNSGKLIASKGWDVAAAGLPKPQGAPVVTPDGIEAMLFETPIEIAGQQLGWLYFGLSCNPMSSARLDMLSWSVIVAVISLLIGAALLHLVIGYVTKPLVALAGASARISSGDFDVRLPDGRSDELGRLNNAFNTMVTETRRRMTELVESEKAKSDLLRQATDRENDLALARDKAEVAAKSKSDFLSVMSHELRNPLVSVIGAIDLLDATMLTPAQRKLADAALAAAAQLNELIGSILDASKLEAGKITLDEVPFDLFDVAKSVQQMAEMRAAPKNIVIRCEIEEGLRTGRLGDPIRLRQVMMNLMNNAIRYTSAGSVTLAVSEMQSADRLMFRVTDTGAGIPEHARSAIFERFYQVDQSSTGPGGAGLGLAISRDLVMAMNGEIGVESREGQGSMFWFTAELPIVSKLDVIRAGVTKRPASEGIRSMVRPTVLVVEDSAENRLIIGQMLEQLDCNTDFALDGLEGVGKAEGTAYDFILMDIRMPRLDGIAATRAIRQGNGPNKHTPIAILTGNAFEEDRRAGIEAGCSDYLAKPVRLNALRNSINRLAGQNRRMAI